MSDELLTIKSLERKDKVIPAGIPVCGGNLQSPVVDMAAFINEVRYNIGGRVYIENAD
jgi:hypothetical protein